MQQRVQRPSAFSFTTIKYYCEFQSSENNFICVKTHNFTHIWDNHKHDTNEYGIYSTITLNFNALVLCTWDGEDFQLKVNNVLK